jgi:hypothetical protein
MERILGTELELSDVEDRIVENFESVFGLQPAYADRAIAGITV